VFLDTHSIRPGADFQSDLWRYLFDSDVMLMLDTPSYFDSEWTSWEFAKACGKKIHILRLVWPDHTPSRNIDLADVVYLEHVDLTKNNQVLNADVVDKIAEKAERLRSRSLSSRFCDVIDALGNGAENAGWSVRSIGPYHAVSLEDENGSIKVAYPVVGLPTAELIHEVTKKARSLDCEDAPYLAYDTVGLDDSLIEFLTWLGLNINDVKLLPVHETEWRLTENE
jgi:hypothetical protein